MPSLLANLHRCSVGQHFHLISAIVPTLKYQFSCLPGSATSPSSCLNVVAPEWEKKLSIPPSPQGAGSNQALFLGLRVPVFSVSCKTMPLVRRTPSLDGKLITCAVKCLRTFYVTCLVQGAPSFAFRSLCVWLLKWIFIFFFFMCCV